LVIIFGKIKKKFDFKEKQRGRPKRLAHLRRGDEMDEKWIRVLLHASIWFAPVLVPLIVFLFGHDRELKRLALQALVFHGSVLSLLWISTNLLWILIGFPFIVVFGLAAFFVPLTGIIRAVQNRPFQYPVIKKWI
jgi:uncharacterized protein